MQGVGSGASFHSIGYEFSKKLSKTQQLKPRTSSDIYCKEKKYN